MPVMIQYVTEISKEDETEQKQWSKNEEEFQNPTKKMQILKKLV